MNLLNMMGKMKEMQQKLAEAKESLAQITETAEAGAGMVKATVNGHKEVMHIEISPEAMDDPTMLADLIKGAVNLALANIEPKAAEHLQKATAGLLPDIPGMDLGKLMGQ